MLNTALVSLYEMFWREYPFYPVVVFHDDLDKSSRERLQNRVPLMVLTFVEIKLALPDGLQLKNVPKKTLCSPKVSTIGYRLMCRFHSTVVHDELQKLPQLSNIEYIMRLDDDSILTSPIGYDLFKLMKVNKKLYGSASLTVDDPICVAGL